MVAIDTCQGGVKQGTTYMVLIMETTQTQSSILNYLNQTN